MAAGKDSNHPVIIIKRRKKGDHDAHHGGAWKVAYADFVTAMMAFFLLLWLLNATTEEQKKGISDYFAPATASRSTTGAGMILGGMTAGEPGARVSRTNAPSITMDLRPSSPDATAEGSVDTGKKEDAENKDVSSEEREEQLAKQEDAAFQKAEKELKEALNEIPELKGLEKNLMIDNTPEGLRIQLVDEDGQPMFASASARPLERTSALLAQVSRVIRTLPNKIQISGHTDAVPFRGGSKGYGNWELSADRAGASRRALVEAGFQPERVGMVVGRAETDPLMPEDPTAARNRRISIVLLREHPLPPKPGEAAQAAGNGVKKATAAADAAKPAAPEPRRFDRDWTGPRLR